MSSKTIAFIGSGNMAVSLISGLVADGYDAKHILASDPDREKLGTLCAKLGIQAADSNQSAVSSADVVVLAVKPQVLKTVCNEIADAAKQKRPLIVSIAAGVKETHIAAWLGGDLPIIRSMPNTPAMVQTGATALHANSNVDTDQKDLAESILRSVGLTCWVEEEALMDAVTALSGSGPAYFFLVMEAMEQAGVELGLPQETAHLLTLQTALGAARMAIESDDGPANLRKKVTSPGGTTERALSIFEEHQLRNIFKKALAGARDRSLELSDMLGDD